jgi:hypothetical protein
MHVQQRGVQPVGQPSRLGRQVGVMAGQHSQRGHRLLIRSDPTQRMRQSPSRVGDHERVPGIGLALTRIQISDPPHRQPRQITDLHAHAAGHRDRQRSDRGGLIDHHQQPTMLGQLREQLAQCGLVVRQRPVNQPPAAPVDSYRVVRLAGHIDPAEHLDDTDTTGPRTVGSRQLTSSSQQSRPATDDAPAATLRAGLNVPARSLLAVTIAQPIPVTPPLRS